MTFTEFRVGLSALALWLLAGAMPALGEDAPVLEDLTGGDWGLEFRWRLEHVNQDNFEDKALGIPVRARVNYGTGAWHGWSAFAEFDQVLDLGVDSYNEGAGNTPDRANYPVIADPAGGDFNQWFLQYQSASGNRLRAGRQRIILDNARFIGNVAWRQNEQTYDGVAFERTGLKGFDLRAAWLGQVNRIFGNDVPDGRQDMDTWLANAAWAGSPGKLTAYAYGIDNEEAAVQSSLSYGLRYGGERKLRETKLALGLEYARQTESGDNPVDYAADYWRVDLSAVLGGVTVLGGYESLGGDHLQPGQAFRTPLATLHAFNGWADQFLTTPDAGLVDAFAGLQGKLAGWSWDLIYHDFTAQSGPAGFGTEWDGSIGRKLNDRFGLLFKAARFDSDSPAYFDTFKLWVQATLEL